MTQRETDGGLCTPQEEAFCRAYADPESETYNNGTQSAVKAGYAAAGAHTAAWKALRRPRVQHRLREIYGEQEWSPERVMTNIAANRAKADQKGDLATVARCDELMAKRLGLLSDRVITSRETPERQRVLDEAKRKMAERLAILLMDPMRGESIEPAVAAAITPHEAADEPFPSDGQILGRFETSGHTASAIEQEPADDKEAHHG